VRASGSGADAIERVGVRGSRFVGAARSIEDVCAPRDPERMSRARLQEPVDAQERVVVSAEIDREVDRGELQGRNGADPRDRPVERGERFFTAAGREQGVPLFERVRGARLGHAVERRREIGGGFLGMIELHPGAGPAEARVVAVGTTLEDRVEALLRHPRPAGVEQCGTGDDVDPIRIGPEAPGSLIRFEGRIPLATIGEEAASPEVHLGIAGPARELAVDHLLLLVDARMGGRGAGLGEHQASADTGETEPGPAIGARHFAESLFFRNPSATSNRPRGRSSRDVSIRPHAESLIDPSMTDRPRIAPYGAWRSTITSDALIAGQVAIGQIAVDRSGLFWTESRPAESGRTTIVRREPDGRSADLLAAPWSARTRAHEYGGGAFSVSDGTVFFSNDADQRIYAVRSGGDPRPITSAGPFRFADAVVDRRTARLVAVREDHSRAGEEPVSTIVAIPIDGESTGRVLVSGRDFFASPRLCPAGRRLAWLAWSHPHMPWDESELWVAEISPDHTLREAHRIAGGDGESIFQPEWSHDGVLHFVSDRSGWWNLYRWSNGEARALHPLAAELGLPQWNFGMTTYAFAGEDRIVCTYGRRGIWHLATLQPSSGAWHEIATSSIAFSAVRAEPGRAIVVAAGSAEPAALIEIDLGSDARRVLRATGSPPAVDSVSVAEAIEFPTTGGETAHAFFYPPVNRDFAAPDGERPPLRVRIHGGPTAAADGAYKLAIQYWTSRGFAVLDVNYRGSAGFGRAYRRRLEGAWGIADVDDCVQGALAVADRGLVDRARLTISGGSAGGYTTLCALTFRDVFRAGASHYGIGDLAALARDTHKFESRYLDSLVAPWPAGAEVYRERSPLFHIERLSCPVIFFQGLDDRVVPPDQAVTMVDALRAKRLPVAYLAFPGEGHGFRRAETMRRALEAEFSFFARVLGFTPADSLPPLEIENL
jgi:dipeptidyl aminopeptidase/acylaminoacyl peptidase